MTRRSDHAVAGIAVAVAVAALIMALVLLKDDTTSAPGSPVALGEQIFRTGIGADGTPIIAGGGMMMRRSSACASCHGADGRGRSTGMFTAPNITYGNLTDPQGMLAPDGTRAETFTDADIRRAVIDGVDPEGGRLAAPMPQWPLADAEWSALLAYLKTLPR